MQTPPFFQQRPARVLFASNQTPVEIAGQPQKDIHHTRIEVPAGVLLHEFQFGIENIGRRKDAGRQWDLLTARVARALPLFVVTRNDSAGVFQPTDAADNALALLDVRAHDGELRRVKFAGFEQDDAGAGQYGSL